MAGTVSRKGKRRERSRAYFDRSRFSAIPSGGRGKRGAKSKGSPEREFSRLQRDRAPKAGRTDDREVSESFVSRSGEGWSELAVHLRVLAGLERLLADDMPSWSSSCEMWLITTPTLTGKYRGYHIFSALSPSLSHPLRSTSNEAPQVPVTASWGR